MLEQIGLAGLTATTVGMYWTTDDYVELMIC